MRVDSYSFGNIKIDGETYTKDVIILPDAVHSPWWSAVGHSLAPDDLGAIIKATPDARPEVLIIGTGASGLMKVPEATLEFLQAHNIEPRVMHTPDAVTEFNLLYEKGKGDKGKNTAAALHLTC